MKGHRSIYQSLFDEPAPVAELPAAAERRGRSEVLKARQDAMIICRYYYHVKLQEKQYEKALQALEQEVYLSKHTIVKIITRESAHLKMLHQAKPTTKYFQAKYPFLNW